MAVILDLTTLAADISREFPSFKIVPKANSFLMKCINAFMLVCSFGKANQFMVAFVTTIGCTVYTPTDWETWGNTDHCEILSHERIHMRQSKRLTSFLYSLAYLIPFFPLGLAFFRAKFEMEAYTESMRVIQAAGGVLTDPNLKARFVGYITGPSYLWAWPFQSYVEKWYDNAVLELQTEARLAQTAANNQGTT